MTSTEIRLNLESQFSGKLLTAAKYVVGKATEIKVSFSLEQMYNYYIENIEDSIDKDTFEMVLYELNEYVTYINNNIKRTQKYNDVLKKMSADEKQQFKRDISTKKDVRYSDNNDERLYAAMKELDTFINNNRELYYSNRADFDTKYSNLTLFDLPEKYNLSKSITTERYLQWRRTGKVNY